MDLSCVLTFLPCREVVTFNHFLEAAAEKEVQGKARLQDFIENLLQRVELAEKQLQYYQSQQASGFGRDISEHLVSPAGPATSVNSLCSGRVGGALESDHLKLTCILKALSFRCIYAKLHKCIYRYTCMH